MATKIKVMHIINNLEVGGAERMLVLLANELARRDDMEVYVVSLEGHGPLVKNLSKNVYVKEFKYHLFFGPLLNRLDPHVRLGLLKYINSIKPDIIHGHLFKGEDFAKMLGCLCKVPVITTSHDTMIRPGRKTLFFNKFLTKAIAVSKSVAEHLKAAYKLSDSKIQIIPNAVDVSQYVDSVKKFDKSRPVFIYIGRLLKSKGIDDAIKGLARLRHDYPDLQFLIYGKEVFGSYKKYLDNLVKKNKYDFVKFMGRTDDVPTALKQGDIFILPSQTEGFAISVLEAAAAGKPIIATRTGAIPDMVIDGRSGALIGWHRPDQIYESAKTILDNNLVEKYGKESQRIARQSFDIKKVAQMHYEMYKKVLE